MSRSNPELEIVNPCKKYFSWDSTNKCFKTYDRTTKKNVPVPLPFVFIVLDNLITIKGFSDALQYGYYSNEVRDLKKDIFIVRGKNGICSKGLYEQIMKENADYQFTQSTYIAYKDGENLEIGNIAFNGASLAAFFEFKKAHRLMEIAIRVKSTSEAKKGAVTYNMPVFEQLPITPESDAKAKELDVILQDYLIKYFKKMKEEVVETNTHEIVAEQTQPGTARSSVTTETDKLMNSDPHGNPANEPDDMPF